MDRLRCAILDDYQDAARAAADWSPLDGRVEVAALRAHIDDDDALAAALAELDIVVVTRERTSTMGIGLQGKQLGLVGLGKMGTRAARVGLAFGMEVVSRSPHLTDERATAAGVRRADTLAGLLAASDFVSLHLVLAASTRGIVDAAALACLRPTAFPVNTARAGLVDEAALLEAARAADCGRGDRCVRRRAAAGGARAADAAERGATPHLGYVTDDNYATYFREVVGDIVTFLAGAPIRQLDG